MDTPKEKIFASDLSRIFESHELADVKLICPSKSNEKRTIPAHRAILAARSSYFMNLFKEVLQKIYDASYEMAPESQKAGDKFAPTESVPIASSRTSQDEKASFLSEQYIEEIQSGVARSPDTEEDHTWPLSEQDEDLSDMALSRHSQSPASVEVSSTSSKPSSPTKKSQSSSSVPVSSVRFHSLPPARLVDGILEIQLLSISYESLIPIIRFLYSMNVDLTTENLVGVFALASEMKLSIVCNEILAISSDLFAKDDVVDLLVEANSTPLCEPLLEALFKWLGDKPTRIRSLLQSPRFVDLPIELIHRMMSKNLFVDEFELYERFSEVGGGEVNFILKNMDYTRLKPEQLLALHRTGKVSDATILEAFTAKMNQGPFVLGDVRTGTCICLEMAIFGGSASHLSPGMVEYIHGVPHSRNALSGTSPASLIRRRSVAATVPSDLGELVQTLGSESWISEAFQVHSGNWSACIKTRGGTIYKIGLILNHTTGECDRIDLDSQWAIEIESSHSPQARHLALFNPATFEMGKEYYKHIDTPISTILGFQTTSFKRPAKRLLQVRIRFPNPENIRFHVLE